MFLTKNSKNMEGYPMKKRALLFLCLFVCLPVLALGEMVQWVDENGVTHYSDSVTKVGAQDPKINRTKDVGRAGSTTMGSKSGGFVTGKPFVISGRIVDIHQRILKSLLDEGASLEERKMDGVGLKVVIITAFSDKKRMTAVNPDEKLNFRFSAKEPINHLTLEVSGGGIYYRVIGPWNKDTEVTIDLEEGLFEIDGVVRNSDQTPVVRSMVSAFDALNEKIVYCYTGSQGRFLFYSNVPVHTLQSFADGLQIKKSGPWDNRASVHLTVRQESMFAMRGLVTDKKGEPIKRVRVSALFEGGEGKSTITRDDGQYELRVDKKITSLYAYRELTHEEKRIEGPFEADQTVNFVFDAGNNIFILEGKVVDKGGAPVYNAFVFVTDSVGSRIQTTRTDRMGMFSLELGKEARAVTAYRFGTGSETTIEGPFQVDATLNISLIE
jgi:hypothetical protein